MVTKEEWNKEISKIRKCLDDWTLGVELRAAESQFIADILDDMADELNYADWNSLQKYLKEIDQEDKEDEEESNKGKKK